MREAAERAGLSIGFIRRVWRVGGIPALPEDVTARERPPVEIKGVGQVAAVELAPA